MSKERFCFKIVYNAGSEPKKILSKFHYDLIDIDDKKRIGASVIYINRKEKVIKIHFKNVSHADSFIHDDLKIQSNIISGLATKDKNNLILSYSIPNGEQINKVFKNYKDLYDFSGEVSWEDMCTTYNSKENAKSEKHSAKSDFSFGGQCEKTQNTQKNQFICPDF